MTCRSPRDLPSVSATLEQPAVHALVERYGPRLTTLALRELLQEYRASLLDGEAIELDRLPHQLEQMLLPDQRRVLNLTGTILHTNLGRAPLGDILGMVAGRLQGYSVLEYDLATGKRGSRGASVERLLRWLTGAEASLVVNNCSAAMILLLTVLAKDREVVVSRGELVEIGGGFRIPDILELSGARLVEVGTTNRTRISDFERAITEETGLLLTTHRSNFEIVGFTQAPTHQELIELGQKHQIPVVHDLGSGMLTSVVPDEPAVGDSTGFDLTAFSGDKLLGGPQCGVIMGSRELVERCRKHPFYRAFRCDKLTLALMEETLRRHADHPRSVPLVELLEVEPEELRARAENFLEQVRDVLPEGIDARVVPTKAAVGGGSLPGGEIASFAVKLTPEGSAQELQEKLRQASTPIVARLSKGSAYLDFRSLTKVDEGELAESFRGVFT